MHTKKILVIALAFIAILLCFLQPVNVYADEEDPGRIYCSYHKKYHSYSEITAYNVELHRDVFIDGVLPADSPITAILRFDIEKEFKDVWDFAEKVYNVVLGPGVVLATAFFLLELMEKVINDHLSAEGLVKMLIKLFLMIMLLMNGFAFLTEGMKIVTWCFDLLQDAFENIGGGSKCVSDLIDVEQTVWKHLGDIFSIYVSYFIMFILKIMAYVTCWKRVMKLIVLVMFAPIGMADAVKGGTSSQGVKYFKKIMAVTFEGTVILGAFVGYQLIKGSVTASPYYGETAVTIILGVCLYMMMSSAGMIAEQILGC